MIDPDHFSLCDALITPSTLEWPSPIEKDMEWGCTGKKKARIGFFLKLTKHFNGGLVSVNQGRYAQCSLMVMVKITFIFDDLPEKPQLILPISESQTLLYAMSDLAEALNISLSHVSLLSTKTRLGIIDTAWSHDLDYMSRNFGTEYMLSIEGGIDVDELRGKIVHVQRQIDAEEQKKEAALKKEEKEILETAKMRFAKLKDVVEMSESIDIARLSKVTDIDEDVIWEDVFNWCRKFGFKVNGNQLVFGSGDKASFFKYVDSLLERA